MISTRSLAALPDATGLRALLQSLAMLDAILCPEWEFRLYSFNSTWAKGEEMGSMRNGCGDDFFALFNPAGCFLKGFAHEAAMTPYRRKPKRVWRGVLDHVPEDYSSCLAEPAFSMEDTTFCIWRGYADEAWQVGPIKFPRGKDPDGSELLLSPLDGDPRTYQAFAEGYFDTEVELEAVQAVYDHKRLTEALVRRLNPETSLKALAADRKEIGYPRRAS